MHVGGLGKMFTGAFPRSWCISERAIELSQTRNKTNAPTSFAACAAFLDHVMAGQAAITTAGLMFTSAALGVLTGRKMAPERPFPDSTQSGISEG